MLEQNQNLNPNLNPMPVTDTTVSVEQVAVSQPKRKWWLIILISVVGILIIGGGVYAFLFFNKPVEKVVDEVVNTEPVVENTDSVKLDLQGALGGLAAPVVLCLDLQKELSQPVSGALICDAQSSIWPALSNGYQWSQSYSSDTTQMTWNYCIYHESDPDIFCDQSGCRQENCRESVENGKQNKNEQQVSQVDTDQDALLDDEELNLYQTNPKNADTDGDGYKDGEEVKNGYNPSGEGILELNENFFDRLANLTKYDDTKFIKFNIFNIPSLKEKLGASKSLPLNDGFYAGMSVSDQVSNVGTAAMFYMKDNLDLFPNYTDLFGEYIGIAGDGRDVKEFGSYYAYSLVIAYPDENSVCDYEAGEMALRQGLITKNGDVYFFGAACVSDENGVTKAKGYIWNF